MQKSIIAVVALLVAGCAASTTPGPASGEAAGPTRVLLQGGVLSVLSSSDGSLLTSEIPVEADRLWEMLPTVYRELDLKADQADPANRVLVFDGRIQRVGGSRLSTYLDCGRGVAGPNADTYEVTLRVATQIVPASVGSEARVQVEALARNRGTSGGDAPCRSSGDLERRIFEMLLEFAGA